MSLRLQRGNLSKSWMDIPKISRNTSGAKWRCDGRREQWSVLMATWMTLRVALQFISNCFEEQKAEWWKRSLSLRLLSRHWTQWFLTWPGQVRHPSYQRKELVEY